MCRLAERWLQLLTFNRQSNVIVRLLYVLEIHRTFIRESRVLRLVWKTLGSLSNLATSLTVTRFKNYEAGRLTSMVTQADHIVPTHSSLTVSSKTGSQKSLTSQSNDGKFSDTTEVEAQDKVGEEECMSPNLQPIYQQC
jgi:hypothetical protein